MKQTTEPFEELFIPQKNFNSNSVLFYRVYSDYKNFELIEATSALDAISNSSIKSPYKIMRHDPFGDNVLHLKQVMSMEAKAAAGQIKLADTKIPEDKVAIVEIPVVNEQQAEPEAVIASVEPTVLSNEDVAKLLNGA